MMFGVDVFSKIFNANPIIGVLEVNNQPGVSTVPSGVNLFYPYGQDLDTGEPNPEPAPEEEPVDSDDGTTTVTEEGATSSSDCGDNEEYDESSGECVCEEGYTRDTSTDECVETSGGGFTSGDSENGLSVDLGLGNIISNTILKATLGVGLVLGAGYAYEKRKEIATYFKGVGK